ncbi:hypothetical protein BJ912DRAFT_1056419 [Pholiota molesta]|nr:hypothetical protein BJ912DRAFT_1056419 [Pholiota molesta]
MPTYHLAIMPYLISADINTRSSLPHPPKDATIGHPEHASAHPATETRRRRVRDPVYIGKPSTPCAFISSTRGHPRTSGTGERHPVRSYRWASSSPSPSPDSVELLGVGHILSPLSACRLHKIAQRHYYGYRERQGGYTDSAVEPTTTRRRRDTGRATHGVGWTDDNGTSRTFEHEMPTLDTGRTTHVWFGRQRLLEIDCHATSAYADEMGTRPRTTGSAIREGAVQSENIINARRHMKRAYAYGIERRRGRFDSQQANTSYPFHLPTRTTATTTSEITSPWRRGDDNDRAYQLMERMGCMRVGVLAASGYGRARARRRRIAHNRPGRKGFQALWAQPSPMASSTRAAAFLRHMQRFRGIERRCGRIDSQQANTAYLSHLPTRTTATTTSEITGAWSHWDACDDGVLAASGYGLADAVAQGHGWAAMSVQARRAICRGRIALVRGAYAALKDTRSLLLPDTVQYVFAAWNGTPCAGS